MNAYIFAIRRKTEEEKKKPHPDEKVIRRNEILQDRLKEIGAMEVEIERIQVAKQKLIKSTIKFIESMEDTKGMFMDLEQELMEDFLGRFNKEMNDDSKRI